MIMKKLYLDPFMDLFNREIISYSITMKPSAKGILDALNEAIDTTSACKYRRTFHSNQGWAYQMKSYRKQLEKHKIFQSMSRRGNCLDNSVMENCFGLLKQEIYYGEVYHSFEELKFAIEEFIEYYNERRIKQFLNFMSPIQYRQKFNVA
jgi:transposase InsO family protein